MSFSVATKSFAEASEPSSTLHEQITARLSRQNFPAQYFSTKAEVMQ